MTTVEVREMVAYAQVEAESPYVQQRFWELINEGSTAQAALMFSTMRAPGVKGGDRGFNENARHRMNTMSPTNRSEIIKIAQAAGINTNGKYYVGGLGRYDDPRAWCSTTDDVMRAAKDKGVIVTGSVTHDPGELREEPVPIKMAPDIRDGIVQDYIRSDEELQRKARDKPKETIEDLRDMVVEKHGKK